MDITLKLFLLILLLFQLFLIISTVRRRKLSMKYGCFWIFLILLMTVVVIFPKILFKLSNLLGFEATSNMIFIVGFFFLFYIIFVLTTSISIQNEKIKNLVQEVSNLKKQVHKDGK